MKKPYDWQNRAFSLFKDFNAFMFNVCCGGGKTFGAILIALYRKLPVIVITPKAICDEWKKELIQDCGVDEKDIFIYNQPAYSKNKMQYEKEVQDWLRA